ncbi:hypothetical protein HEP_00303300 [Hepatocystis sp. ex Piliocolobus tephrosceles]|nr:hypothetical protein HEP_00303300 [Hepatocystis sp. ex Piliocolobus tephrosceles]
MQSNVNNANVKSANVKNAKFHLPLILWYYYDITKEKWDGENDTYNIQCHVDIFNIKVKKKSQLEKL